MSVVVLRYPTNVAWNGAVVVSQCGGCRLWLNTLVARKARFPEVIECSGCGYLNETACFSVLEEVPAHGA